MKPNHIFGFLCITLLTACAKDNIPAYNETVRSFLSVEFDNIAGASDLELHTGSYTDASGEHFTISKLKYYVSNFILTSVDGTEYTVPPDSCYFLIDESDESTHEPVLRVPEGEYKNIRFILGVDSAKSTRDLSQRTGVLDPDISGGDMYWAPDSGYIFLNMEGSSAASANGNFQYHIGGYGADTDPVLNNIRIISLDLSARGEPIVKTGREPNIHLMVDILKLFNGASDISIASHPVIGFDDFSKTVSSNYTDMFRHDHTENE